MYQRLDLLHHCVTTVENVETASFACRATLTRDEDGAVHLRTPGLSGGAEIQMVMEAVQISEVVMLHVGGKSALDTCSFVSVSAPREEAGGAESGTPGGIKAVRVRVDRRTYKQRFAASPPELLSDMIASGSKSRVDDRPCDTQDWDNIWYYLDIVILITGVVANAALLWLFLMEKKSLSASKVLGLNLVVMDLIFLCTVPVNFINRDLSVIQNRSGYNPNFSGSISLNRLEKTADVCSMFNLMGCPLLLTCMCVERYLAVMRPVLYLRARKWEYRVAVSAAVWAITLVFVVATIYVPDEAIILAPVSIIISFLFILMLLCLGSVIWSLRQQSPALSTQGKQRCTESTLKKQAVRNVLIVVVPAVMSYLPVLMMSPLVLLINYTDYSFDERMLGVFIGPLFYFSKAKQMCCLKGARNKCNEPDT
ncbi:unnamed protein product [Pleuronectes platessa]|uniref:G-protein coupled receptors family 1 profile domain-containing protein n=1 Tax=Pleuronectes platessa TaxID=8262 RepID=A0A9N7V427_PLEPL|nr:unnamed protein product [Pleuronectes platessa]